MKLEKIIGLKEWITCCSYYEIAGVWGFLKTFDWKKALLKNPPEAYMISDMFSVCGTQLFSDSQILGRNYVKWNCFYDFVIKGPKQKNAEEIFIDILIKFCLFVEKLEQIVSPGIFVYKVCNYFI